ncbi:MarR family winged helix-turn-helix transcriptional regulator [Rhizobium sp. G21]|nr:MarR family transcriptional regulator [Rhizobium sp. G21]
MASLLQDRLKTLGIAPAQFAVMLAIDQTGSPLQKDIVEALDQEQATVANTLARMERDGLVVRSPYEKDARVQKVSLTPRAKEIWSEALEKATELNELALSALTREERDSFILLMQKVIYKLRAENGKPPQEWEERCGRNFSGCPEMLARECAETEVEIA